MNLRARLARGARWLFVAALGCSSHDRTPTAAPSDGAGVTNGACSVVEHVEVPLDLFGELSDPPLVVPFGARFALVDDEGVTLDKTASAAVVSWQGVDENDAFTLAELCPDGVCRNIHGNGVLGATSGGLEFVLAEQGSAVSMPAYPLRLMAWDSDGGAAQITPLFDSRVTAITTRTDLESSRDAARAVFALGNTDMSSLEAVEIEAGATLVAPPAPMTLPSTPWDCLAVVPTDSAGAVSAVTKLDGGTHVMWSLRELDAEANVVFETSVDVPVGDALDYTDCPAVIESPQGFHAQWVNGYGAALLATVSRDAAPGDPLALLALDASPGPLAAVVHDQFLFLAMPDGEHQSFVRLAADGSPGGPPLTLPVPAASTLELHRASPRVLRVNGALLDLSYELDDARAFEEESCP